MCVFVGYQFQEIFVCLSYPIFVIFIGTKTRMLQKLSTKSENKRKIRDFKEQMRTKEINKFD